MNIFTNHITKKEKERMKHTEFGFIGKGLMLFSLMIVVLLLVGVQGGNEVKKQMNSMNQADDLFNKKMFQEALKEYESIYKTAKGDEKWKSLYRIAESKALLFRYGEAVQTIVDAKMPEEATWQARFLILRTELFREFVKQYGHAARTDVVEGEKDITRKTPQEMHAEIQEAYAELAKYKDNLIKRSILDENYFIDTEGIQKFAYPSVWDFVVLRWSNYLLTEQLADPKIAYPKAMDFLGSEPLDIEQLRKTNPDILTQAAVLMEEAAMLERKPEWVDGGELWKTNRVMLPFYYNYKMTWSNDRKAERARAEATLTSWQKSFKGTESAAEAGYLAAWLLNQEQNYEGAVTQCKAVLKNWQSAYGATKCEKLIAEITNPSLQMQVNLTPGVGYTPQVTTRNLKMIYFRLYSTTPPEIVKVQQDKGYGEYWSQSLNYPAPETLKYFIVNKQAQSRWKQDIKLPKSSSIYEYSTSIAQLPKPAYGVYVLVASSDAGCVPGESLINGAVINVTDIMLIGTSGFDKPEKDMLFVPAGINERTVNGFFFYAMNGITGAPLSGAEIDLFYHTHRDSAKHTPLRTDGEGRAELPITVQLQPYAYNYFYADPLMTYQTRYAYWSGAGYLYYSPPPPITFNIDIDRPIYRPGQKVLYKVTTVMKTPRGLILYHPTSKLSIRALDVNGQELYKEDKATNAMGSVSGEFLIPTGRMLGNYSVQISINEWGYNFTGYANFQVEEYKRPEFEVKLADAKGVWRFGKEAEVEGDVQYYFGGAVPDAPVLVKISRQTYIPWFCWWWSWRYYDSGQNEILRKELKTDPKGHFKFTFTPDIANVNEKDPLPARFNIEVESRDTGGRTITASKSYVAGKNAYLFSIEYPSQYFTSGASYAIPTKMMNLNEQMVSGSAKYELYRLDTEPKLEETNATWYGNFQTYLAMDKLYQDIPNGAKETEGALKYDSKESAPIALSDLRAGAHRLTLKTTDPWGNAIEQSVILMVTDAEKKILPVKITNVTIPEHEEYLAGETARFLIGSHDLTEAIHIELWQGQHVLAHKYLPGTGIRIFEFPLTSIYKGGFALRWFGVKNYHVRSGQVIIRVPWKEKNLTADLHYDKKLAPGQKITWWLEAKDIDGKPVTGEALVSMFDRSLEYYMQFGASWLTNLYPQASAATNGYSSTFNPGISSIRIEKGWIKKILDLFQQAMQQPNPPMLRSNKSRIFAYQARGDKVQTEEQALRKSNRQLASTADMSVAGGLAPAPESGFADAKSVGKNEKGKDGGRIQPPPPPPPRTNFAETAFFEPQLAVKNGKASFSFTVPEQLTGWRIRTQIVTADLKTGLLSNETVTQKDLMVRVEMPRFFREGDEGTIKAVVHNETEKEMFGTLALSVTEDGKSIEPSLAMKDLEPAFSVKPHSLQAFSWSIKVPREISFYKVKAIARSNELADSEERELPILPSRQRLIETKIVALNGDITKIITLKAFDKDDPTRQNESMVLQVDPQLALTILNSIPFLVKYPFECVEQLLNRYVPLAIVNEVYKKYPNIAKAVAKIPRRDSITPEWDRTDPRRMISLLETPWEEQSKGIHTVWPIIDMLNPETVKREKQDALGKLIGSQLSNGAFSWFPGGREDTYMTLYVLAGFAEAKRYGVEIPENTVRKALGYVNNEIPRHLKPEPGEVQLLLYAAYVVTSYPKDFPEAQLGYKFAQAWIDYADKHSDAMTPYGKALAAYTYMRLGNKLKANSYLDRAMDGAREDEIAGVYFTPEKNSWLWYNDTVETHAFLLRTLQTLRPADSRIPGMVQWLIFNRKGNEWKSTKASSAAVFTLLDFMKQKGALDRPDQFTIAWGDVKETVQVQPDDWLSKPFRWTKTGADITSAYNKPQIEKKGPGFAFASLTWTYSTDQIPEASEEGLLNIERTFYLRVKEADAYHLKPLKSGDTVNVGDQIEVQLKINTRSQFEYMHLKDLKGAGFEAEELLSGWKWDQLPRYEEPRDSLTNFFISWLPHGEYILRYRIRPTTPGKYRIGAAILQSMYAPEFTAHSAGFELSVR